MEIATMPKPQVRVRGTLDNIRVDLLNTVWQDQLETDMIFSCPDGSVGAHKALLKTQCPVLASILPPYEPLPGGGPPSMVVVPNFSIKIVRNFLEMLYTGSTGLLYPFEMEELKKFGFNQLGFAMILNYNIFIESPNQVVPEPPKIVSVPQPVRVKQEFSDMDRLQLNLAEVAKTLNDPNVDYNSTRSGSRSRSPNLVIDDSVKPDTPRGWWASGRTSMSDSSRLRCESTESSDPLVEGDSDFDSHTTSGPNPQDFLSGGKVRRKRTSISSANLVVLRTAFNEQQFPNRGLVNQLSAKTGLHSRVIKVWFQNERAKMMRKERVSLNYDVENLPGSKMARQVMAQIQKRFMTQESDPNKMSEGNPAMFASGEGPSPQPGPSRQSHHRPTPSFDISLQPKNLPKPAFETPDYRPNDNYSTNGKQFSQPIDDEPEPELPPLPTSYTYYSVMKYRHALDKRNDEIQRRKAEKARAHANANAHASANAMAIARSTIPSSNSIQRNREDEHHHQHQQSMSQPPFKKQATQDYYSYRAFMESNKGRNGNHEPQIEIQVQSDDEDREEGQLVINEDHVAVDIEEEEEDGSIGRPISVGEDYDDDDECGSDSHMETNQGEFTAEGPKRKICKCPNCQRPITEKGHLCVPGPNAGVPFRDPTSYDATKRLTQNYRNSRVQNVERTSIDQTTSRSTEKFTFAATNQQPQPQPQPVARKIKTRIVPRKPHPTSETKFVINWQYVDGQFITS